MNFSFFISGVFMATFAASGLFFLKFWKSSDDRFFLWFGVACFLIAIERVALTAVQTVDATSSFPDATAWVYSIRLLAFLLIILAIISKNRKTQN